nr:hypothetical protein [Tanacetum cinerariifolium]
MYQADDLDAYDSGYDELNTAKVTLMANLSHYGSDALVKVHNPDNVDNHMINLAVQVTPSSEQSNVMNNSETEITRGGHISKQCTKPKRKRDDSWFKDKVLLVQAQANGQILHEEELAVLADPGILKGQAIQTVITHNVMYQADDLDAYDSDYDELNTAKVTLMANLSHYGSDSLVKVHNPDNVDNHMINLAVQVTPSSEQS